MRERYNCAESVLLAVCQARGLALETPRIATAFGGGIGGTGATCGALVGAVMAASLRLGRDGTDASMRDAYKAAQAIYAGFEAAMGAVSCRELTGLDLRTREGGQQLYQSGTFERVCLRAGAVAAGLAEAALGDAPGS